MAAGPRLPRAVVFLKKLPREVSERLVRVRHAVDVFASRHRPLCMDNAEYCLQFVWLPNDATGPTHIALSTDGYSSSYTHDQGFLSALTGLASISHQIGSQAIQDRLPNWLEQISREGSGDDVTLALIQRVRNSEASNG